MHKRSRFVFFLMLLPVTAIAAETPAGGWQELCKSGGSQGAATVYAASRKQVLSWGGIKSGNEVRALDLSSGKWTPDYASDQAAVGGNFYGGQGYEAWLKATNRPGPFFLFRQACWDSRRNRMVIVALNVTAAYDPQARQWTDLKAGYEGKDGVRKEGCPPPGYQQPWFAPVPGQWGSCAYDPVNDEVVLFPLWATRVSEWTSQGGLRPGPDLPGATGVRDGHYGSFVLDLKTNTWRNPELGGKDILALRARLAGLISEQRAAARESWDALMLLRQELNAEAAKRMPPAAETQKALNAKLADLRAEIEKAGAALSGFEATQAQEAAKSLAATLARLEKAAAGLASGKPADLPALQAQQYAGYRELHATRDGDLYVQPPPRCSTSVVCDSKNQVLVMAGGTRLDRALNDTWVYQSKSRRWQRRAPAPEALEWPGMCFDSKRGLTMYAAAKGLYAYDAAKDQWFKAGPGIPKYQAWCFYCDMAYDEAADRYVLNVARDKYSADETTYVFAPGDRLEPVAGREPPREKADDEPFPPPASAAALDRLKSMPANTWTLAKVPFEPTHRSWSTMSWDDGLRCVIYQGGGHAGTMDNTISAYFPESNTWVNAFPSQYTPSIFGSWSCASSFPSFDRGMGLSAHCRYYESLDGEIVAGSTAGFQWSMRERPADFRHARASSGFFCLYPQKWQVVSLQKGNFNLVGVYDLKSAQLDTLKPAGPAPNIAWEWSGMAVHPDKNWLVLHGAGQRDKKTDYETWVLDLSQPSAWRKLDLKSATPQVGMSKLSAIPATNLIVCAMPESNDLWVLDLDKQAWKPLPVSDGDDKLGGGKKRFEIYGQCVYDPHRKLFVMVGLRGSYEDRHTYLLKPDFSAIDWSK